MDTLSKKKEKKKNIYIYICAGVLRCRCLFSRKTHFWSFLVFLGVLEGQERERNRNREKERKRKRERERKSKHQASVAVNADIREELINYCNHARI